MTRSRRSLAFGMGLTCVVALSLARGQTTVPNLATSAPSIATTAADSVDNATLAEQNHAEGVRLLRTRKLDESVELLRTAVTLEPKNVIYVTDLGYAYLKQRRLVEAEDIFKQAIALDPGRYHAYEHLEPSVTLQPERWEKRKELLAILDHGLEVTHNNDSQIRIALARIRAERAYGQIERARAHLDALIDRQSVPRTLEKAVQQLATSLDQDRQAQALRDWPEPVVEPEDQTQLLQNEQNLAPEHRRTVLAALATLIAKYPAWRAPRWLRAQRLAEQGHYDEAVKDLTVLARLAPSDARYHRLLGTLLAEHGGLLELDRADRELQIAFSLEPEWSELATLRTRLAARRGDTSSPHIEPASLSARPTENAIRLYEEVEALLESAPTEPAVAIKQLEQALRESPSFIEAAVLLHTLTGQVPQATVTALWHDPAALLTLYRECTRLVPPPSREVTDAWLARSIELGNVEARLTRALAKKSQGRFAEAEVELSNYLASVSNSEEVEAVQALRSELVSPTRTGKPPTPEPSLDALDEGHWLSARFRLLQGDAKGALELLDAPCKAGMSLKRLIAIGVIHENNSNSRDALDCYELGFITAPSDTTELTRRAARLLARSDRSVYDHPTALRLPALAGLEPAASWALAKQAMASGKTTAAEEHIARYLSNAVPEDRFVAEARTLQAELNQNAQAALENQRKRRHNLQRVGAAGALALVACAYLLLFRGTTVARALRRRPRMFPELSRVVGELRHDVFKHRTSALELLVDGQTNVEKLRSTLLEPVPTSEVVAEAYTRVTSLARAQGLTLRRLQREPVFGPLVRDLERAEAALTGSGERTLLMAVDTRLRSVHLDNLSNLLAQGPHTRLDAVELQRWIAAVEAEYTAGAWSAPALHMSEPALDFPLDKPALFQIFSNLLRNAENAVGRVATPRVQVSMMRITDFTGQTLVRLQVSDNAPEALTTERVDHQDPRRGLGIVRETVRDWNGILVVQPDSEPYSKAVGAQFPQ